MIILFIIIYYYIKKNEFLNFLNIYENNKKFKVIRNNRLIKINFKDIWEEDTLEIKKKNKILFKVEIIKIISMPFKILENSNVKNITNIDKTVYSDFIINNGKAYCKIKNFFEIKNKHNYYNLLKNLYKKDINLLSEYIDKFSFLITILVSFLEYLEIIRPINFNNIMIFLIFLNFKFYKYFIKIYNFHTFTNLNFKKINFLNYSSLINIKDISIICSDKTGTLTKNEMSIKKIFIFNGKNNIINSDITGDTFNPNEGEIINKDLIKNISFKILQKNFEFNNISYLIQNNNTYTYKGNATESSMICFNKKVLSLTDYKIFKNSCKIIKNFKYSYFRKKMSTIILNSNNNEKELLIKGGAEMILKQSKFYLNENNQILDLDQISKDKILEEINDLAKEGYRMWCLSYKKNINNDNLDNLNENEINNLENNSIFIGYIAVEDKIKYEIKNSVELIKKLGISLFIISGDMKDTAFSISSKLNIFNKNWDYNNFINGDENNNENLKIKICEFLKNNKNVLFSRTTPKHKEIIINILKDLNKNVLMIGDGINDINALKVANIGITMGITGNDNSKNISDIIIKDDNFNHIINLVIDARKNYLKIIYFLKYIIMSFIILSLYIIECIFFWEI